jgi:hypothetical protein
MEHLVSSKQADGNQLLINLFSLEVASTLWNLALLAGNGCWIAILNIIAYIFSYCLKIRERKEGTPSYSPHPTEQRKMHHS